ncbi:MAG: hypothetical protein V2B13_01045 [Pseudomonadota bacterium]
MAGNYNFDHQDFVRLSAYFKQIEDACRELKAFSLERGGIPVIDRNIERITAPLEILLGISEILETLEKN